jgi:hypothetical protein
MQQQGRQQSQGAKTQGPRTMVFCAFLDIGVTLHWECTFCPLHLSSSLLLSKESPWCPAEI